MTKIDFITKEQWETFDQATMEIIQLEGLEREQQEEYEAGQDAGRKGYNYLSNPNVITSRKHHWWHNGWLDYMSEIGQEVEPAVKCLVPRMAAPVNPKLQRKAQ